MPQGADARLSIHSVEEREATAAVCVVRCVGGVARTGQRFAVEPYDAPTVTLEEILRYARPVEFVDPPHNAKVRLTGEAVGLLVRGAVVTAVLGEQATGTAGFRSGSRRCP